LLSAFQRYGVNAQEDTLQRQAHGTRQDSDFHQQPDQVCGVVGASRKCSKATTANEQQSQRTSSGTPPGFLRAPLRTPFKARPSNFISAPARTKAIIGKSIQLRTINPKVSD
jgi:hypothetical protein